MIQYPAFTQNRYPETLHWIRNPDPVVAHTSSFLLSILQNHKGRGLVCWLPYPQVFNKYVFQIEKKGKTGRRKKVGIVSGSPPWALHIRLFVVLFIGTQQEKETTRGPDLRQTKHVALIIFKRICYKLFAFYGKTSIFQAR